MLHRGAVNICMVCTVATLPHLLLVYRPGSHEHGDKLVFSCILS